MHVGILLILDKIDNTLYPISIFQNYSNYMDIYKQMLSTTTLTQKDISIDEFVDFLTRKNKVHYLSDGYNIKDYTLFYI